MEEDLLIANAWEMLHSLSALHPITLSYASPDHLAAQPSHMADPQLA